MGIFFAASLAVTTWVVPWDGPELPAELECFDEVHPFAMGLREDYTPFAAFPELLERSKALRVGEAKVVPVVVNDIVKDGKIVALKSDAALTQLLSDPKLMVAHVEQLRVLAEGFDGLEIDYERMPPALWGRFTDLIERLGVALHAEGKLLYVDIEPRPVYDAEWAARTGPALARAVDGIHLMAYYGKGGASMHAAAANPLEYVSETARKDLAAFGPDKLIVALTLAGTEWTPKFPGPLTPWKGRRVHYREVVDRLGKGAEKGWDEASSTPWFEDHAGGKRRRVFYEDERSLEAKAAALRALGVRRIGHWYWGRVHPDPSRIAGPCRR